MCDHFDDYEDYDDFDDSESMDEYEPDDPDSDETESQDDDMEIDPFLVGGWMGFAYEEGLRDRKRRKMKRNNDDK